MPRGDPSNEKDYHVIRLQLPKVELHAHLNGCIPLAVLQTLALERGVTLPTQHFSLHSDATEDDNIPDMYNVRPRSLQDCFDMFAQLPRVINDLVALERITEAALQHFCRHHTVYLELRSTPKRLLHDYRQETVCSKREYVETIVRVMQRVEQAEQERYQRELRENHPPSEPPPRLPLKCRLLLSVDRSQSIEEAAENISLAIAMSSSESSSSHIVGVDLGGNPTQKDFGDFRALFCQARAAGVKVTIHCGEIACDDDAPAAEASAILDFGPDRLGHGVLLPPDLLERLEQLGIPVETCPTSNVMTLEMHHHEEDASEEQQHGNLVWGLQRHAGLAHWLRQQHPLAICTDDPGVFDTSPTQELWLLRNAFSLSLSELWALVRRSLDFAFCSEESKAQIRQQMEDRMEGILLSCNESDVPVSA